MYEMWKRQQEHEVARTKCRAEVLVKSDIWEDTIWLEEWTSRESSSLVQKMFGPCETENGCSRAWQNVEENPNLEDGRGPSKGGKNWRIEGHKRRITRKEYRRLWNEIEMGGFLAQKGLWNLAREKMLEDRGALPKEEGDIVR